MANTRAPWISAWDSLPSATSPLGSSTTHVNPARAEYAAAAADVLPVEAHITTRAPFSTASLIASVMPRSLNEAVGFMPSNFKKTRSSGAPIQAARRGASISGVCPSHRDTTGVAASTGRNGR